MSNIVGAEIERVVLNGDGSDANIAILYSLNGFTNANTMDNLDAASKSYVRAWMSSHPGQVIDQRTGTHPNPTPTPNPTPVVCGGSGVPTNVIIDGNIPQGGDFAATRAYLSRYRDWQPIRKSAGTPVVFVFAGGLCDVSGHFYTGYGGNASPGTGYPCTPPVGTPDPGDYVNPFPSSRPQTQDQDQLIQWIRPLLTRTSRLYQGLSRWIRSSLLQARDRLRGRQ